VLINCPECKNSVSDKAVSCPFCGYPFETIRKEKERTTNNDKWLQKREREGRCIEQGLCPNCGKKLDIYKHYDLGHTIIECRSCGWADDR
jgi:ribosomal protein S27E